MKNIVSKILIIGVILVSVWACSDEFTNTTPVGALSDEALQNELGVDLLLTGAYSVLDGENRKGGADWHKAGTNWWMDVISDDAHKGSTDGDQADLYSLETFDWATSNSYLYGKWKSLFAGINRCNAVINVISGITDKDFSAKEAEARFLRAHYNFELQKMWGNVPFISLEAFQNSNFNQPNPGPIWDKIEADLTFAIENLPDQQDAPGRPTSWTAKAFMGRAKLWQQKWSEALSMFQDVINNGPYSLLPEYVDNFRLAGDNSPESIFAIQFTADDGQSFNGDRGGTLNFGGPNGWCCGFYQPSQNLVNAFQTTADGLPLMDNTSDVTNDYGVASDESFTPHTGPLDPRLDYTVGRRGIQYNGWGLHPGKDWIRANFADISGPYLPKKNVYYKGEDANMGTGGWGQQRSGINYHIMRYADLLLMAAEAAVEMNDLSTALDYVNQVRERAKNMTYVKDENGNDAANYVINTYDSFPNQDMARAAVRMERRLELGMEGKRLFDLRRWGNGAAVMNQYAQDEARVITSLSGKMRPYEDKHNLFPIPLNAIDLSGNVLTQNPGY